jgi:dTDP-4-amino-4,6-dideoxygalactose transaminase
MTFESPLYVTQPSLPPLEEFIPLLREIWNSKCLTNCGPFHQQLEAELSLFLGVHHISLFGNGTLALLAALRGLGQGEVITTPFSFVATAHAVLWSGLKPVFADIDPVTLTLDPKKVEALIGPHTRAILPVHVYGIPCDVEGLKQVAERHGLKLIYDAAHAFDVRDSGGSVLRHGDLSILSFHATKVFTTFEGGAVISPDAASKQHLDRLRNFGIADEVTVLSDGINGKMSEVQAALGLLQLRRVHETREHRMRIDEAYRQALVDVPGIECLPLPQDVRSNFGYFPIMVTPAHARTRDELYEHLRAHGVIVRRYFHPLISDFPMYRDLPSAAAENLSVARLAAERILCLPIHGGMEPQTARQVVGLIRVRQHVPALSAA